MKQGKQKSPMLIIDDKLMEDALKEAGKIMVTAFEMLGAKGFVKAELVSNGKKYEITFKESP